MDPRDWMKEGEYLPEFLRDFHDAKDFFKTLQASYKFPKDLSGHTWVSNHIFTVDFFLWFCGIHGYTLQKSRKKGIDFEDLAKRIDAMKSEDQKRLIDAIGQAFNEAPPAQSDTQGAG